MSSILLRKEHAGQKPGTVISVPFLQGKLLIKAGVGEWWDETNARPEPVAVVAEPAKSAKSGGKGTEVKGVDPASVQSIPPTAPPMPMKPEFPPQPTPHPVTTTQTQPGESHGGKKK